jgi:hypothetical protein
VLNNRCTSSSTNILSIIVIILLSVMFRLYRINQKKSCRYKQIDFWGHLFLANNDISQTSLILILATYMYNFVKTKGIGRNHGYSRDNDLPKQYLKKLTVLS